MDRLIAGDGAPSSPKRSEMLTRVDPSLDRAVVLFQDVMQVRYRPVPTVFVQSAFSFEPHDRRRVRAVAVGVDNAGHGMVLPSQRFGQKAFCCGRVLLGREEKVEGRAGRIHRTIQVAPLALDPDVGLVHPPTVVGRVEPRAQTSFHFRGVTLYPSPHRDVIGVQASLGEQLLDIAESEKRRYQPTASRITSGSNWRHLNSPEIDGTRSIGPAYQVKPPNFATLPIDGQS